jgi:uncharacterized protein YjdB
VVLDADRFCSHCRTPQPGAPPSDEDSPWDEVLDRLRKATTGEFVIKRELGKGGMAAVYLAHDVSLNRQVAIKVMSPGLLMGPGMVDRFKQEAVTVANLSHPHIVTIHAVRQRGGLHFFVMKLVPGRSLERIIAEQGPLPVALTQAILFQVGSALAYAHRRGVVHRDIKPGNILMDEDGNAIVTDFGIAKVREGPTHTMTGATVGTPAYMSPEQCWSREVTGASDQYSLGVVAYEMLTGKPPFTGPTLGVLRAHVEDQPQPLDRLRPDCPPDLAAGIARMLAKEPSERWPDIMQAVTGLGGRHLPDHDPLREPLAALAMANAAGAPGTALRTPVSPIPSTAPTRAAPLTEVVVRSPRERAPVGETVQLRAEARDAAGATQPGSRIRWTSSDPTVATVSVSGIVTPLAPGNVTITALSDEGPSGVTVIEVTPPAPATAEVTGAPAEVALGEVTRVGLLVRDAAGRPLAPGTVQWTSSDPTVLSVSSAGQLRALSPGTATLTGSADGGVAAAAIVVVRRPAVASVQIDTAPSLVVAGESARLHASARDNRGVMLADRLISWTAEPPEVARVSSDGTLTAIEPGVVRVTAACEGHQAAAEVQVAPAPVAEVPGAQPPDHGRVVAQGGRPGGSASVDSAAAVAAGAPPWRALGAAAVIAIAATGLWLWHRRPVDPAEPRTAVGDLTKLSIVPPANELAVGKSLRLGLAPAAGDGALRQRVVWSTTDSTVVSVSAEGVATGRAPGDAIVIAASGDNKARATVRVLPADAAGRPGAADTGAGTAGAVAAIAITGAPPRVTVRDSFELRASAADRAGTQLPDGPVTWQSSRPAVATVSPTGAVTALAEGSATITATRDGREASVVIRVAAPAVARLSISPTGRALLVGDSLELVATMRTAGGDTVAGPVTWTSSDARVVRVEATGWALAVSPGPATITATAGRVRATAAITAVVGSAPPRPLAVAGVIVTPPELRLRVGDTARVAARPRDAQGTPLPGRRVTWRPVSDPRVARVDAASGLVTALAPGRSQLVAESEGVSASVMVVVEAAAGPATGTTATAVGPGAAGTGAPGTGTPSSGSPGSGSPGMGAPATAAGPITSGGAGGAGAFRLVTAGGGTCGLLADGSAACWGQGQTTPARVGSLRFTGLSTGTGFTCGLVAPGQAYCWGANGKGQLGDGTTKSRAAPALVSADLSFMALSAGDTHACAVTPGGNVYCWGDNGDGQLGDGSKDRRTRPTQIRESQSWKQVAAGGQHSCALTAQGKAYCWGDGFSGELGQGMVESSLEPVAVSGSLTFVSLTAGRRHTCGLTAAHQAYCWGDNSSGQLGNAGGEDAAKPVAVSGGHEFVELSAGSIHTCGVTTTGQVACWGGDGEGQLGVGRGGNRNSPAMVPTDGPMLHVSAGATHTCAVSRAQATLCWGGNSRGQLGDGTQASRPSPGAVRAASP